MVITLKRGTIAAGENYTYGLAILSYVASRYKDAGLIQTKWVAEAAEEIQCSHHRSLT